LHQSRTDDGQRGGHVTDNELSIQMKHAVAEPSECPIPAAVRRGMAGVVPPVHFHDEPRAGRQKVDDESAAKRHLPLERHPELAAAQVGPQTLFRRGSRSTHPAGTLSEELGAIRAGVTWTHSDLLRPALQPGAATQGEKG
jgi:hypothetical protein